MLRFLATTLQIKMLMKQFIYKSNDKWGINHLGGMQLKKNKQQQVGVIQPHAL